MVMLTLQERDDQKVTLETLFKRRKKWKPKIDISEELCLYTKTPLTYYILAQGCQGDIDRIKETVEEYWKDLFKITEATVAPEEKGRLKPGTRIELKCRYRIIKQIG